MLVNLFFLKQSKPIKFYFLYITNLLSNILSTNQILLLVCNQMLIAHDIAQYHLNQWSLMFVCCHFLIYKFSYFLFIIVDYRWRYCPKSFRQQHFAKFAKSFRKVYLCYAKYLKFIKTSDINIRFTHPLGLKHRKK